jgi:hypothetical protein
MSSEQFSFGDQTNWNTWCLHDTFISCTSNKERHNTDGKFFMVYFSLASQYLETDHDRILPHIYTATVHEHQPVSFDAVSPVGETVLLNNLRIY